MHIENRLSYTGFTSSCWFWMIINSAVVASCCWMYETGREPKSIKIQTAVLTKMPEEINKCDNKHVNESNTIRQCLIIAKRSLDRHNSLTTSWSWLVSKLIVQQLHINMVENVNTFIIGNVFNQWEDRKHILWKSRCCDCTGGRAGEGGGCCCTLRALGGSAGRKHGCMINFYHVWRTSVMNNCVHDSLNMLHLPVHMCTASLVVNVGRCDLNNLIFLFHWRIYHCRFSWADQWL